MSVTTKISHHVSNAAAGLRHVFVRELEVMATLGIYEHEKLKPQRIIVSIDLSVREGSDPVHDDISHGVHTPKHDLSSKALLFTHENPKLKHDSFLNAPVSCFQHPQAQHHRRKP